jgi:hypothetical protein
MSILGLMGGGQSSGLVGGIFRDSPYGPGRAAGGFVSGPRTRIMGYHHGGEFVMNARATEQNRDMLESMNQGKAVNSNGGTANMNVTVLNYAGVDIQTRQLGPTQVQIIARQVAREEAAGVVATSMNDPNSRMSKQLSKSTSARRQR